MLVEFLGLPGVGKSTLARDVAARLTAQGVPAKAAFTQGSGLVDRLTHKAAFVVREICARPVGAMTTLKAVAATRQQTRQDFGRMAFNLLFARYLLQRDRPPDCVVLLEQGIGQAFLSLGLRAKVDSWADATSCLPAAMPVPDMLVLVEADLDTVTDRLAARPGQASRIETGADIDRELLARFEALLPIVQRMLQRRHVPIVTVANNRPEDRKAAATLVVDRIIEARDRIMPKVQGADS